MSHGFDFPAEIHKGKMELKFEDMTGLIVQVCMNFHRDAVRQSESV